MSRALITDDYLGKLAWKKHGFFSGLVGKIERSNAGITPYILTFESAGGVGVQFVDDIELYEGEING